MIIQKIKEKIRIIVEEVLSKRAIFVAKNIGEGLILEDKIAEEISSKICALIGSKKK